MPLTPYMIEQFGGLRLDMDPMDVGATQAVAINDIDVDIPGEIRTRPGRAYEFSDEDTFSSGGVSLPRRLVVNSMTTPGFHIAAVSNSRLAVYTGGNVYTAAVSATSTGIVDLLPGPGGDQTLVMDDTGIKVWDNPTHTLGSAIASTPHSGFLCRKRDSSRTVAVNRVTGRVSFSDPGASTTYGVNNFVDIDPDAEHVTGVCELNDLVVVFKETRAFVFYSESTDADGEPIFPYRAVSLGDKITSATSSLGGPGRFSSDGNAIYYVASQGVWAFTGGPPTLISRAITPVFRDEVAAIGTGLGSNPNAFACATADRVYVSGNGFGSTLMYDKATSTWTVYGFEATAMAPADAPRSAYLIDTALRMGKMSPASTTDYGGNIDASRTSGQYSIEPGRVAITLESSVVGSGTVSLRNTTDVYGADAAATSMTLGVSPATAEGWHQVDNEGTTWQHTLSWSGQASVTRVTHHVSFVKPTGVR